jgi:hypothetical protein
MSVFGAGASAFCAYDSLAVPFRNDKGRPPLGPELFAERYHDVYEDYPGVIDSLWQLQGDQIDVEGALEEEWKEVAEFNNPQVIARHINIQYYVQNILCEASERVVRNYNTKNIYGVLADKLAKHCNRNRNNKLAFVLFNQDTILESFVSKYFRKPIEQMSQYVDLNFSPFVIFKPHGSWNWGWKFHQKLSDNSPTPHHIYTEGYNYYYIFYQLLGSFEQMIDWNGWGWQSKLHPHRVGKFGVGKSKLTILNANTRSLRFPGLLLPYRDKDEFTMPNDHFEKCIITCLTLKH